MTVRDFEAIEELYEPLRLIEEDKKLFVYIFIPIWLLTKPVNITMLVITFHKLSQLKVLFWNQQQK